MTAPSGSSLPGRREPRPARRWALGLWVGLAGGARAGEPPPSVDEAAVVAEVLGRPVVRAQLAAVEARLAADGTAPPALANPFLEARHEGARGPAGADTDAITASWLFDLGFAGGPSGRSAAVLRAAGADRRRVAVAGAVCAVRHATLGLWAAEERRAAVEEGHERLERLVAHLDAMAAAGELARYDVERVAVADAVHQAERSAAVAEAERARAALGRLLGGVAGPVALLPVEPHPALAAHEAGGPVPDPLRAVLEREASAAALRVTAAKRAAVPDLLVFGGARWDAPPGTGERAQGWEAGAAVELPLAARNQRGIADAEAALAEARAAVAEREAEVRARVAAVMRRLAVLDRAAPRVGAELWSGAVARYVAGEASIDELLTVAADVEAARVAAVDGERLRREAHLELGCVLLDFPEPALRPVVEEALR